MLDKRTWILPLTLIVSVIACQGLNPSGATPPVGAGNDPTPAGFALASVTGSVWADDCDSGIAAEPPLSEVAPNCVAESTSIGPYHADGQRQAQESGIGGVTVALLTSVCPGTDQLQTTVTGGDGTYSFSGLDAGSYCVTIDPNAAANQDVLLTGIWTHPQVAPAAVSADVVLHAGEAAAGPDFGWDSQSSPLHVHAAVWDNDYHLQVFDTGAVFDPQARPTSGLMPSAAVAQGQVFALSNNPPALMMSTSDGPYQLAFVENPDYGVAIWPGGGDQPPQLAWSAMPHDETGLAAIYVSNLDGTAMRTVYSETFAPQTMTHLVVQGWASDGAWLIFSREPFGIGGYIPFGGASSLYLLRLADGQVTPWVEFDLRAGAPFASTRCRPTCRELPPTAPKRGSRF